MTAGDLRAWLGFGLIILALGAFILSPAWGEQRIRYDEGGVLAAYVKWIGEVEKSGEKVVIDGHCFSSCTLVLALPPDQVCFTERARLFFHAPYREVWWFFTKRRIIDQPHTEYLMSLYPRLIRGWIGARGGLGKEHIVMDNVELKKFVRPCPEAST